MAYAGRLATVSFAALLSGVALADPILKEPAAIDPASIQFETVAEGLNHPWSIAFLPDGSMLVTERNGSLRAIRDGKLVAEPIAGLPPAFQAGQGGYHEIALDPDFATNKRIFVAFAEGTGDANHTAIARATYDGAALSNVEVIFRNSPEKDTGAHFGGRMVFLPDGTLLLTTGDGFEYREEAQDKTNGFGKIVRLTVDGKIPADNPFVAESGARPELYTLGHRNPQGLTIDPATGTVWESEHGALSGDEINRIEKGANYGWPIATYSLDYSGSVISPYTEQPGTTQPLAVWKPERFAPSGLAIYRGPLFPAWDGALLAGSLTEACIDVIRLDDAGAVASHERLAIAPSERVRDVKVAPDGSIYVLTDEENGKILRLTPKG